MDAEDLADTNFACYLGLNLQPVNLEAPSYNPIKKTLTLKPTAAVSFKDIGFIKFGNKDKDQNFCDQATFQYTVTKEDRSNDHQWILNLGSQAGGLIPDLVATITQMDD